MKRIIVEHGGYGCETGCCGHYVILYDENDIERDEHFVFSHPDSKEDELEFAKQLITDKFGEDHVADLDWENSTLLNDDNDW